MTIYFHYFIIIYPLEKGRTHQLYKQDFLSTKDVLCQVWLKLVQWFLRVCQYIFAISLLSPLRKRRGPSFKKKKNLNPNHPGKDALCQGWWKLAPWLFRRRFLNFVYLFLLLPYYLPLENGVALHLNNLEFPLPKDALCQFSLKLALWFFKRRSF